MNDTTKTKHRKVMNILAEATGGKSYKAHKYAIDHADRPSVDYGDSEIIWKRRAETTQYRTYVDLSGLSKKLAARDDQILSYFLDGSRRVFKVDDIAYAQSGGRSAIYPVIAGQIGVGCCHRVDKKVVPVKFKREFVLSMPDKADADGKSGFWPAMAKKLSECDELKRLGIEFATILPYKTSRDDDKKFEDRATACVQDRMIECEKKLVAELVREGKLNQDNFLVKDGSLEYRPTKEDKTDKKKYQTFKNNYNWAIGASKNFNPEVCAHHGCARAFFTSFISNNLGDVDEPTVCVGMNYAKAKVSFNSRNLSPMPRYISRHPKRSQCLLGWIIFKPLWSVDRLRCMKALRKR
jgi:hypothetical protein